MRGGFTWTTLQKQSSSSMSEECAVEFIFSKSCARRSDKKRTKWLIRMLLSKVCRGWHHELPDSTSVKAFITPRVAHFSCLSTRVTESLQLQLDCRFEIQIYDRTPKIRKFIVSSISNLLCSGSEPAQNRFWAEVLCMFTVNNKNRNSLLVLSDHTSHKATVYSV